MQRYRNLSTLEEKLKLAPIIALATVVFGVGERVHANICREVPAEDLSDEESVVEGTSHIFDGV